MNSAPELAFYLVLSVLTLAWLWRELPLQYVLTVAVVTAAIAALGCLIAPRYCWWLPLVVLNSRGVSRVILYKWRERAYYGWWVMGLTCVLSVLIVPHWSTPGLALLMQLACVPWLIKRRPGWDAPHFLSLLTWLLLAFLISNPRIHL